MKRSNQDNSIRAAGVLFYTDMLWIDDLTVGVYFRQWDTLTCDLVTRDALRRSQLPEDVPIYWMPLWGEEEPCWFAVPDPDVSQLPRSEEFSFVLAVVVSHERGFFSVDSSPTTCLMRAFESYPWDVREQVQEMLSSYVKQFQIEQPRTAQVRFEEAVRVQSNSDNSRWPRGD
ncbi:MAG: hypothetical protein VX475_23575 [Myxococcota bacterium]|jgi:hypothetical protein|nr:hypothetical protein [Myxococcota bacterium]